MGVRETAGAVVPHSRRVRGTVRLTSGLDPHDRVDQRVARARRRPDTEPSAEDVAPVTPLPADVLHARTALVHDEVRRESLLREKRSERVDVELLRVVLVALRDGVGRVGPQSVVVGHVYRSL